MVEGLALVVAVLAVAVSLLSAQYARGQRQEARRANDLLGEQIERNKAAEQAAVIAFLASPEAGHVTGEIVETGRRGIRIGEVLGFVP